MSVRQRREQETAARTRLLVTIVVGTIVGALILVLAISVASDPPERGGGYQDAIVQGGTLDQLASGDNLGLNDPALGKPAPIVEGFDLEGNRVRIKPDGRPTVVLLLAHWCPHCQREVPRVVEWFNALDPDEAPRMVAVATAIDRLQNNFPPEAWLEEEEWPTEVLYDPQTVVPPAFGSSGYPFFIVLDGQGRVVRRISGGVDLSVIDEVLAGVDA